MFSLQIADVLGFGAAGLTLLTFWWHIADVDLHRTPNQVMLDQISLDSGIRGSGHEGWLEPRQDSTQAPARDLYVQGNRLRTATHST